MPQRMLSRLSRAVLLLIGVLVARGGSAVHRGGILATRLGAAVSRSWAALRRAGAALRRSRAGVLAARFAGPLRSGLAVLWTRSAPLRGPIEAQWRRTAPLRGRASVLGSRLPAVPRSRVSLLAAGLVVIVGAGTGAGLAAGAHPADAAEAQPRAAASAPAHQHQPRTAAKHTIAEHAQHLKVQQAKGTKAKARANARTAASWDRPVSHYSLTAGFGIDGSRWSHKHSGQDFAVPIGTPVHAAHRGTVVKAGPYGGGDGPAYGNAIVIKNGSHIYSQYAHLSKIKVHVGQHVKVGQTIGLSGNTGNTSGPHLHFEIRTTPNYGSAIDPLAFLRHAGVTV